MSTRGLLAIIAIALACLAASYISPWLTKRRTDDEIAGAHDEWDGGDATNWKG